MSVGAKATYKSGNILSYAILAIAVFLLVNLAIVSGLLFLAGGLILMPRFERYVWNVPAPIGWVLIAIAFIVLP